MAKQGFKQAGNFHLAANSGTGSPLTQGMVTKDVGGVEQRYLHNNGVNSVYLGALAGPATVTDATSGVNNVGIGHGTLTSIDTTGASQASSNTAVGGSALTNVTTGSSNVSVGGLAYLTTGNFNTGVGAEAGQTTPIGGVTTGTNNTLIGYNSGGNLRGSESYNTMLGNQSVGIQGLSGYLEITVGDPATPTTGGRIMHNYPADNVANGNNFFIGYNAGNNSMNNNASSNYGIGNSALNALTSGFDNISIGDASCLALTTGSQNVVIGKDGAYSSSAGLGLISGSQNVFVGMKAGGGTRGSESANVYINEGGANTGESNTLRIGGGTGSTTTTFQLNRAFICGIRGITTGVNDAVAVLVDSANQLGTVSSSLRYKTNIQDLGSQSEVIYNLKPKSFEFRQHPGAPAWGLIAEEVDEVFPQLCVYKDGQPEAVKYHDLVPLLLNEVQKLRKELDELKGC